MTVGLLGDSWRVDNLLTVVNSGWSEIRKCGPGLPIELLAIGPQLRLDYRNTYICDGSEVEW